MKNTFLIVFALLAGVGAASAQERWNLVEKPLDRECGLSHRISSVVSAQLVFHAEHGLRLEVRNELAAIRQNTVKIRFDNRAPLRFGSEYRRGVFFVDLQGADARTRSSFIEFFKGDSRMQIETITFKANATLRGTSRGFDELIECAERIRQTRPPPAADITAANAQERWELIADPDNRFCALRYQVSDDVLLSMGLHATYGLQLDIALPGSISAREGTATLRFVGGNNGRYRFPARFQDGVLSIKLLDNEADLEGALRDFVEGRSMTVSASGLRTLANVPLRGTARGFENLLDCRDAMRALPPLGVQGVVTPRSELPHEGFQQQVTFAGWIFGEINNDTCFIRATVEPNMFVFDFHKEEGFVLVMGHEKADLNDEFFVAFTLASGGSPLTYSGDDILIDGNTIIIFANGNDIVPIFKNETSVGVMFPSAGWVLDTEGFREAFEMFNECAQRMRS